MVDALACERGCADARRGGRSASRTTTSRSSAGGCRRMGDRSPSRGTGSWSTSDGAVGLHRRPRRHPRQRANAARRSRRRRVVGGREGRRVRARRRRCRLRQRSTAGATALCVTSVAEALALRPAVPEARILVLGPDRRRRARCRPRSPSRAHRSPTSACPRASPCTSSSTPAWAGGAWPSSSQRPAATSWG